MNLFSLSLAYLRSRRLTSALLVLLLVLGVATTSLLLQFKHQTLERLSRDARGFDLVVGAKGSPLQLILSSIYHMDIPTGNIPITEANRLRQNPQIKQAIPLALGDNYRGFRIIGTETSLIEHYQAELAGGTLFSKPMEAVAGARAASDGQLALGKSFAGSHGLSQGGEEHTDSPYTIVGILKPTGTVLDRLILTPVESVWKVHGDEAHHHHDHEEALAEHDEDEANEIRPSNEITALLIRYRSSAAAMSMPREINRTTSMQAASPPYETARLLSLMGMGLDTLRAFGLILIASAVVGMLVAIYQSMQERRYDMALMRVLGAPRNVLMRQVLIETAILLAAGIAGGLLASHVVLAVLPSFLPQLANLAFSPFALLKEEWIAAAGLFAGGLLVALLPAISAYRMDVSRTLARA